MLKQTFAAWNADKAPRLAAAIAYAAIFAIAPLLIVAIALAGAVLGFAGATHPHSTIETMLVTQIAHAAGSDSASMVRSMVDASFGKPRANIVAQVLGWVTFVIGATGAFAALQDALNTVWDAHPAPGRSFLIALRDRVASAAMLLVIGALILGTFALNVAIAYVASNVTRLLPFPGAGIALDAVNWLVSVAVIAVLFGLMFKVLPDVEVRWRDVRIGALCTAVLFVLGQALIGYYIGTAGLASVYGAAGALLAVLLWAYYSAAIVLLGAEFTKVYAHETARQVTPEPDEKRAA